MSSSLRQTQRRSLTQAFSSYWIRRHFHRSLDSLIAKINSTMRLDSASFYMNLDDCMRQMLRTRLRGEDRLEFLLLGLKIINLLAIKHDYIHRRTNVAGNPIGYLLDPTSGCNLGCPSCSHTFNRSFAQKTFNLRPEIVMKPEIHEKVLNTLGLTAFAAHYFNKSEPFLNKHVGQFIADANRLRIKTVVSSHMVIPKLDAEAIVASGLDVLQVAVDGATQRVYELYRKGGDIEVALRNIQRIVEEKLRQDSETPRIRWVYLAFEHNVHEIDDALDIARRLGINEFVVARPIDVSQDDSSVVSAWHPGFARNVVIRRCKPSGFEKPLSPIAAKIESELERSWHRRLDSLGADTLPASTDDRCDWLYMGVAVNAFGEISPCVIGDTKDQGRFQFGNLVDAPDFYNSSQYVRARKVMSGIGRLGPPDCVRCETCNGRPAPVVGLPGAHWNLVENHGSRGLSSEVLEALTGWSSHRNRPHWVSKDVEQICR